MHTFTDTAGRAWSIVINVDALKRVKALLGVNLLDVADDKGVLLGRLTTDPVLLCDVIYAACKPEADAKGVTDEEFGRSMAGDAIEQATGALLEEIVAFFPFPKRKVMGKALEKLRALEARVVEIAEKRLDSPELERLVEEAMSRG
jgi:hypothetical protein